MSFSIKDSKPSSQHKSGKYKLVNPDKYIGLESDIQYRSSYELAAYEIFDLDPNVIRWIAESDKIKIPYVSTIDKKHHHYFPDAYVEIKTIKGNNIKKYVFEIKPKSKLVRPIEPRPPVSPQKRKAYNRKLKSYIEIMQKKKAAIKWCEIRGFQYEFMTEDFLFKHK